MEAGLQSAYDQVLYPSISFPQTHPARLATVAFLRGMRPAPIDRCRVLELGCGAGRNLLPMAFYLPDSEFVGLDLARQPIAFGQAFAADLGSAEYRTAIDGPLSGDRDAIRQIRLHYRPRRLLLGSRSGSGTPPGRLPRDA